MARFVMYRSQGRVRSNLLELGGLHIGGGINEENAIQWLELGAEKVCLSEAASRHLRLTTTRSGHCHFVSLSWCKVLHRTAGKTLSSHGEGSPGSGCEVLIQLRRPFGILISCPISCRRRESGWFVAMNRWQDITEMEVNEGAVKISWPMVISLEHSS